MSEEGLFITLSDEEGNEFELEILDEIEFEGKDYTILVPSNIDELSTEDPNYGLIILCKRTEDGEDFFDSIDDDDELERVYEYYESLLDEEEE